MYKKHSGFTLTELLVVIGIIAALAAIIIINMGSSREKAKDAAISVEMDQILTSVELETKGTGDYTDICDLFDSGERLEKFKLSIENKGGIWEQCDSDANSYAIIVQLNSGQTAHHPFTLTKKAHARAVMQNTSTQTGTSTTNTSTQTGSMTHTGSGIESGGLMNVDKNGVHSTSNVLLRSSDIQELRNIAKENGEDFVEPQYYCVGVLASSNEDMSLKGYLYDLPASGCGLQVESLNQASLLYQENLGTGTGTEMELGTGSGGGIIRGFSL